MFDYLSFNTVSGLSTGHDLKLFGLSTCGFCKRALAFLKEHKLTHSYVFMDELPLDIKRKVQEDFYNRFKTKMLYPSLLINGKDVLVGFIRISWEETLGLK